MTGSLSKPFPLEGERVGMGVEAVAANAVLPPSGSVVRLTTSTPNPGPSPLQGEGSVPHV